MCKLRASGALADSPDAGRTPLEPLVAPNETARVQSNSGHVQADIGRVRDAAHRRQQMAAFDRPFSSLRPDRYRHAATRSALDAERGTIPHDVDPLLAENSADFVRHVGVLALHDLPPALDDGDS